MDMRPINSVVTDEPEAASPATPGLPGLLVTTTDRPTGAPHTTTLGYIED